MSRQFNFENKETFRKDKLLLLLKRSTYEPKEGKGIPLSRVRKNK